MRRFRANLTYPLSGLLLAYNLAVNRLLTYILTYLLTYHPTYLLLSYRMEDASLRSNPNPNNNPRG